MWLQDCLRVSIKSVNTKQCIHPLLISAFLWWRGGNVAHLPDGDFGGRGMETWGMWGKRDEKFDNKHYEHHSDICSHPLK